MKLSVSESEFFSSVKAGDISAVIQALRSEPYLVNFQDEIGKTPLYLAVEKGLVEMVKLLLDHGADLDFKDDDGNSLFHTAIEGCLTSYEKVRGKFIEIAKILLASGIAVNATNQKGFSCLHNASISGDKEMVSFLIKEGGNVNLRDHNGYTPLLWSLCANIWETDVPKYLETLDTLINSGADVNAKTDDGKHLLGIAKEMNPRPQIIKFLQEHIAT